MWRVGSEISVLIARHDDDEVSLIKVCMFQGLHIVKYLFIVYISMRFFFIQ